MSQSTETLTNVRREVIYTNQSYDNTLDKLYSSIGKLANAKWGSIAKEIKSYDKQAQEYFIAKVEETIGPHGFMIFNEFDHGAWIPLFVPEHKLKLKRIILGNPLIAITMLKHDTSAGLYVPVELLVKEKEDGGTDLIYNIPSNLIANESVEGKPVELRKAAEVLDQKLRALLLWVAGEEK